MNPIEYLTKLEQLAEVKALKPPKNPGVREANEPEEITREGQIFTITKDDNPSWPVEVKKLKRAARPCDYCENIVKNQTFSKRILTYPVKHWRESCDVCSMTKNPTTGEFDIPNSRANIFFTNFFDHKK
jgi:hypothetical protein